MSSESTIESEENKLLSLQSLVSKLTIGQILPVSVIKKINQSQYLIDLNGVELKAVSEIDLLSKIVWVKITHLKPLLKIQVIVSDENSYLNDYYQYISDNELEFMEIPSNIMKLFDIESDNTNAKDLYNLSQWYFQKSSWGLLNDDFFKNIFKKCNYSKDGFSIFSFLNDFYNFYKCKKVKSENFHTIIFFNNQNYEKYKHLLLNVFDNALDETKFINYLSILGSLQNEDNDSSDLGFLFARNESYNLIIPLECYKHQEINYLATMILTKHFEKISFKAETSGNENRIILYFENHILLNHFKEVFSHSKEKASNAFCDIYLSLANDKNLYKWVLNPHAIKINNYPTICNEPSRILSEILLSVINEDYYLE